MAESAVIIDCALQGDEGDEGNEQLLPPQTTAFRTTTSLTESRIVRIQITGYAATRVFTFHRDVLYNQSGFFKGLIDEHEQKTRGAERDDKAIVWLNVTCDIVTDVDCFACIADWLYNGKADFTDGDNNGHTTNRESQTFFTRIYIQADRLMIPKLQNQIVDRIIGLSIKTLPSMEAVGLIVNNTVESDPLQQYLQDRLIYGLRKRPHALYHHKNNWHIEAQAFFENDASLAYKVLRGICTPHDASSHNKIATAPTCKYHIHGDGAPASECTALPADDDSSNETHT